MYSFLWYFTSYLFKIVVRWFHFKIFFLLQTCYCRHEWVLRIATRGEKRFPDHLGGKLVNFLNCHWYLRKDFRSSLYIDYMHHCHTNPAVPKTSAVDIKCMYTTVLDCAEIRPKFLSWGSRLKSIFSFLAAEQAVSLTSDNQSFTFKVIFWNAR